METSSCLGTKLFIAKDETFPVKRTPVGWNTLVRVLSDVQLCIQSECRGFDRYASFRADSACEMKETATILLQFCLSQPTTVRTIRRCSEIRRSETQHIRIQNTRAGLSKFDVMEVMQLLLNIQKAELSCRWWFQWCSRVYWCGNSNSWIFITN